MQLFLELILYWNKTVVVTAYEVHNIAAMFTERGRVIARNIDSLRSNVGVANFLGLLMKNRRGLNRGGLR
jgi:hypothetical protein